MGTLDYEQKMNSKAYRFFDCLFKIVLSNIFNMIISLTIIGIYPSIVATIATLKQDTIKGGFVRSYFSNLIKYLKKSLIVGIISLIIFGIAVYAMYFYSEIRLSMISRLLYEDVFNNILNIKINLDAANVYNQTWDFLLTGGFVVNVVFCFITLVITCNLPFIFIEFPNLNIRESIRTSFYISLKYIQTTLVCFIGDIVIIGLFVSCLFDARLLAVFLLIGISLPLFLEVTFTYIIYEKLKKLNIERIMHDYGDDYE